MYWVRDKRVWLALGRDMRLSGSMLAQPWSLGITHSMAATLDTRLSLHPGIVSDKKPWPLFGVVISTSHNPFDVWHPSSSPENKASR